MTRLSNILSAFSNKAPIDTTLFCNDRLKLEYPRIEHFAQWREVRANNHAFLRPWEPKWTHDALSKKAFEARVKQVNSNARLKFGFSYLLIHEKSGIIGGIGLYNVRFGSALTGTIGYWLAQEHNGQGHMNAALKRICKFGFETQKLKRIESACLQHNARSIKLLESCGFEQEGIGKSYLEIDGKRQDHFLFSRT